MHLRIYRLSYLSVIVLIFVGCATWVRFSPSLPDPPKIVSKMPIRIAISGEEGLIISSYLKDWNVFEAVSYYPRPYNGQSSADAVLILDITENWGEDSLTEGAGKAWMVGGSLYLLSPFVGFKMSASHVLNARLNTREGIDIATYTISAETTAKYGVETEWEDVRKKTREIQIQKLSISLVNKLIEDWPKLSKVLFENNNQK